MSCSAHYSFTVYHTTSGNLFTTDQNTGHALTEAGAYDMFDMFCRHFPAEDGFGVSMIYWDCKGQNLQNREPEEGSS